MTKVVLAVMMLLGNALAPAGQGDQQARCEMLRRMVEQPEVMVGEALTAMEREGARLGLPAIPIEDRQQAEATIGTKAREIVQLAILATRTPRQSGESVPPQAVTTDVLWNSLIGAVLAQLMTEGGPPIQLDPAMQQLVTGSLAECGLQPMR
jgi:hypothetical protein